MIVYLVLVGLAAIICLWVIPKFQLRAARSAFQSGGITLADLLKAENDRRATLAQIFAGVAVLTGLYYNSKTARLQESGQLTDRINKAVEQLASKESAITLGGIHQLGRIASDNDDERLPMLHILTNFIEDRVALKAELKDEDCDPYQKEVIDEIGSHEGQAVVEVMVAQVPKISNDKDGLSIDKANLRYIDFRNAHLGRIELAGDDLTGANLRNVTMDPASYLAFSRFTHANLSQSTLSGVNLEHACLVQSVLRSANLRNANLAGADLRAAKDLENADFSGAILEGVDIRGADLSNVRGLTKSQLRNVRCDSYTRFPAGFSGGRDSPKCRDE